MVKGTYKYIPKEMVEALDDYKSKFKIGDSEAFKRMVKESKIGREVKFTIDLNFGGKKI